MKLAILGSGRGSNFMAIAKAIEEGKLDATIELVISDKPDAMILTHASSLGIKAFAVPSADYPDRKTHEEAILNHLESHEVDLVVLAGYMRILTPYFIEKYRDRIINIHPSLLPSFKGLHAQKQALEYGVKVSGATVHLVNEEVDAGKILAQRCVPVFETDTVETLSKRILTVEHELLPEVLMKISMGEIQLPRRSK